MGNHVYLAEWENGSTRPVSSHLACFHGGNWLLGGKLTNNNTIVQHALELVDACWNTYESTSTGIGPESFSWVPQGSLSGPPSSQRDFYNQHGFYTTSPAYILRPEVLESNFYAYRVTGDTKYLDRAAKAIDSFNRYLALPGQDAGYAGIFDVNNPDSKRIDDTESFWFAEVLKYLYLTFDDPAHISLDKYVFNTEAHPYSAPDALEQYGTGALRRESAKPFSTKSGPLPVISPIPGVKGLGMEKLFESMEVLGNVL
jgi:mannosyl-oligosaccharide alpha-1,2-mannosidase